MMPKPGSMINLSPGFTPAHLKGLVIHPNNALQFDFLIQKGDGDLNEAQKNQEYNTLIKYFLASLTVPDADQWVNLSPYENNRIIKDDFGKTEMGRDLLAQDYLLKQITSSLMYPESGLGRSFWDKVYAQAYKELGNTNIPVNTFNKVWIIPDQAVIHENGNTAFIVKSHLKVMMEEDYLATQKHTAVRASSQTILPSHHPSPRGVAGDKAIVPLVAAAKQSASESLTATKRISQQTIREIMLPVLEKEVNEGKNFAQLRQVFSGMILATWYKKALKESLLGKIYADKAKVRGVTQPDPKTNEAIYRQYLQAFKKGVYNYIKEDEDRYTHQSIPRKYFAGGIANKTLAVMDTAQVSQPVIKRDVIDAGDIDAAMADLDPNAERGNAIENDAAMADRLGEAKAMLEKIFIDNPFVLAQVQKIPDIDSLVLYARNFLPTVDQVKESSAEMVLYGRLKDFLESFDRSKNTNELTDGTQISDVVSFKVLNDLIEKKMNIRKIAEMARRLENAKMLSDSTLQSDLHMEANWIVGALHQGQGNAVAANAILKMLVGLDRTSLGFSIFKRDEDNIVRIKIIVPDEGAFVRRLVFYRNFTGRYDIHASFEGKIYLASRDPQGISVRLLDHAMAVGKKNDAAMSQAERIVQSLWFTAPDVSKLLGLLFNNRRSLLNSSGKNELKAALNEEFNRLYWRYVAASLAIDLKYYFPKEILRLAERSLVQAQTPGTYERRDYWKTDPAMITSEVTVSTIEKESFGGDVLRRERKYNIRNSRGEVDLISLLVLPNVFGNIFGGKPLSLKERRMFVTSAFYALDHLSGNGDIYSLASDPVERELIKTQVKADLHGDYKDITAVYGSIKKVLRERGIDIDRVLSAENEEDKNAIRGVLDVLLSFLVPDDVEVSQIQESGTANGVHMLVGRNNVRSIGSMSYSMFMKLGVLVRESDTTARYISFLQKNTGGSINVRSMDTKSVNNLAEINSLGVEELRSSMKGVKHVSQFQQWQALRTDKEKLIVAGVLVLRKINERWMLMLGKRTGEAADKVGEYTPPVGKVDNPENALYENDDQRQKLKESGLLVNSDLIEGLESIPAAGVRELDQEAKIQITAGDLHGRIDDYTDNAGRILVNLMVYVDSDTSSLIKPTRELSDSVWVPLDILGDETNTAGQLIEEYLQSERPGSTLMRGLKTIGLENLRKLVLGALKMEYKNGGLRDAAMADRLGDVNQAMGANDPMTAVDIFKQMKDQRSLGLDAVIMKAYQLDSKLGDAMLEVVKNRFKFFLSNDPQKRFILDREFMGRSYWEYSHVCGVLGIMPHSMQDIGELTKKSFDSFNAGLSSDAGMSSDELRKKMVVNRQRYRTAANSWVRYFLELQYQQLRELLLQRVRISDRLVGAVQRSQGRNNFWVTDRVKDEKGSEGSGQLNDAAMNSVIFPDIERPVPMSDVKTALEQMIISVNEGKVSLVKEMVKGLSQRSIAIEGVDNQVVSNAILNTINFIKFIPLDHSPGVLDRSVRSRLSSALTVYLQIRVVPFIDRAIDKKDAAMKSILLLDGENPVMSENLLANPGGIDMNASNMDLVIKRNGKGMPLPIALQDMAKLAGIEGFVPCIIEIRPAKSMPIFQDVPH